MGLNLFGSEQTTYLAPSSGGERKSVDDQIATNEVELEQKRHNLYEERLGIIKGQGGQIWSPTGRGAPPPNQPPAPQIAKGFVRNKYI